MTWRHIAFSGGRSSGYMLHRFVEAHGGLPPQSRAVFTNTGKEREETLEFVHRCAEEWGIEIDWIEYRYRAGAKGGRTDPKNHYQEVDYRTASRDGEPFAELVRAKRRLPNALRRTCTAELKVGAAESFLRRAHGWPVGGPHYRTVLGIRYDEPRRWQRALYTECRAEYPLVDAKVSKADVLAFWKRMPFDLALPPGDAWSNCDLCFLKPVRTLASIAAREPERLDWWVALEEEAKAWPRKTALRKPEIAQWYWRLPYSALRTEQAELALDGEEPPPVSCFCGD